MPDLDGISATREIVAAASDAKVVILTTFEQDDYVFGALNVGVSGFLLKRTRPEELISAIHTRGGRRRATFPVGHAHRGSADGASPRPIRPRRRA